MRTTAHGGPLTVGISTLLVLWASGAGAQISCSAVPNGDGNPDVDLCLDNNSSGASQQAQVNQSTITSIRQGPRQAMKALVFRKVFAGPSGADGGGLGRRGAAFAGVAGPSLSGPRFERAEPLPASERPATGLAAGEAGGALEGFGVWSNLSLSAAHADAGGTEADTNLGVLTVGIDRAVDDRLILGLALSLSASRADARFISPIGPATLTTDANAISVSPYAAYILNENVYFDGLVGVSGSENRVEQINDATQLPISTGEQHVMTPFTSVAVNYIDIFADNYGMLASAAFNWAMNVNDDFVDDQNVLQSFGNDVNSQVVLGVEVGRPFGDGTHIPYVFGYYEYDLSPVSLGGANGEPRETPRSGLRLGAGLDSLVNESLVVSVEGGALLLKEDYLELGATLNVRWDF